MSWFLLIWSINCLGFIALASSMNKHQKQIYGKTLDANKTRLAQILGWVLLLIAFIACISKAQLSNMISYWIGVLTFSALFVGLCLSYFETQIKKIAIACIGIALISLVVYLI